jgi:N-acetylglucosamine malate deacetylase 1
MTESLHVLAVAAHPDDAELSCGGTICKLVDDGYRVGIVDLTRGELGTRGTPELREKEARAASEILGIHARVNLGLPDGDIENTAGNRLALIRVIRRFRPHMLLVNAPEDRHPDHPAAANLAIEAQFYAGLARIGSFDDAGAPQAPWRPQHVLHYMQSIEFTPTFVVDVSRVWPRRMKALRAFGSQFHQGGEEDPSVPSTFISAPEFIGWIEARARVLGYRIGADYGEGLLYRHGPVGVDDLYATLKRPARR